MLVDRLVPDSLRTLVESLSGFRTRFVGTDSNRAAGLWILNRLRSVGYVQARFDSFRVTVDRSLQGRRFVLEGVLARNIIAVKRGTLWPDRYLVLGAHYDSMNLTAPDSVGGASVPYAPGANDNATGVAGVLEIARLLRREATDLSIVFCLFDAEELGLWGSRAYSSAARARQEDIRGMFSIDAIGTRSTEFPRAFTLDATSRSIDLAREVTQAALDYTSLVPRSTSGTGYWELISNRGREGCDCSDHQSFSDQGFPGLGAFQYFGAEAVFHTGRDTVGAVDFSLAGGIVRAAMAGCLRLSGFPGRSADFDGNGTVDFEDFFSFSERFGASEGEAGFEGRFDLDRDGTVGLQDFFIFADRFGNRP